jgi:hypothetical protein
MKKLFFLFTITSVAVVGMQSCKKDEIEKAPITQTVSAQLKANESYTFTLTKNTRDDEYRFVTQAQHAKVSSLGVDAAGNRIYSYTPELNYVGTDQVIVSNDWERDGAHPHNDTCTDPPPQGNPPPHNGNCGKGGEEDHYIVTINFTINDAQTTAAK